MGLYSIMLKGDKMETIWISKNRAFSNRAKAVDYMVDLHDRMIDKKPTAVEYTGNKIRFSCQCVGYIVKLVEVE